MLVIGLTGALAMGKTTTGRMFAAEGAALFDADAAVHAIYAGPAAAAVEAAFPGTTRGGAVDRALLSAAVARDPAALPRLEALVHPMVAEAEAATVARARGEGRRVVVIDSPLLLEAGGVSRVDVVVVASAPEAVQRARILARPGMTEAKLAALLARQWTDAEKRRHAHFVIDTGAGLEPARKAVRDLLRAVAPLAIGR